MSSKKHLLLTALIVGGMFLSGCGSDSSASSSPSSQVPSTDHHYDERNFVKSDRSVTQTKIDFYDGPSMMKTSEKVGIKIEDQDLFVYETRVNHRRKFTYDYSSDTNPVAIFDFEGSVHVDIEIKGEVSLESATVSPLVYGIEPAIEGNHIRFTLDYQDNYVIEYNGNSDEAIHLFANPIETDPISAEEAASNDSIVYIGPGVWEAGAIPVQSGSTIYIAGGAYVYGQIRTEGLENVTIRGRGIISGEIYERTMANQYTIPVEIRTSKHVVIEDLTFLDPAGWCIALYKSEDVTLNNIKIITARANGDGISVQSCTDVTVNGGFVRSWDDSLVVKNVDRGNTKNILFDGVTVWTDLAQSMEVGYETYGPTMDDITFRNITVVHNYHKPLISLHNSDDAHISNVHYEQITLEDGQMLGDVRDDGENDFFIDMTIAYSPDWTKSEGVRGSVETVTIQDVKVYRIADTVISRLNGESADSKISGVTIKNIDYAGKNIQKESDLGLVKNSYVEKVTVISDSSTSDILGAKIQLPYQLNLSQTSVEKTVHPNIEQQGLMVPEFAYLQGGVSYIGVKSNVDSSSAVSTHGSGNKATTEGDDGSGSFEENGHAASYAFDGKSDTYYENPTWKNTEDEFAALTMEFAEPKNIGVIRVKGTSDNTLKYTYHIAVFGRKKKSDGTFNEKYTRISSSKNYTLSPAYGNLIDINITTQEYMGLQLRLFRTETLTSPKTYQISEVEFYAPSLTYNKAIVSSTTHNDVYDVGRIVDGDVTGTSYYESKTLPAHIIIDLEDVYELRVILLSLCPSLLWETRTQNIEISVCAENKKFESSMKFDTVFAAQDYVFDPQKGNRVMLEKEEGIPARFLKIVINSNSANGGYGGQLAEVSAYGN